MGIGHSINGILNIERVRLDDIVAKACSWGMGEMEARDTLSRLMVAVADAIHEVAPPDNQPVVSAIEATWSGQFGWARSASFSAPTGQSDGGMIWIPGHQRSGTTIRGHWRSLAG